MRATRRSNAKVSGAQAAPSEPPNSCPMDTVASLDEERRKIIQSNNAMLAAIGVSNAARSLSSAAHEERKRAAAQAPAAQAARAPKRPRPAPRPAGPSRRSQRLAGAPAPCMVELDDEGRPMFGDDGDQGDGGAGPLDLLGNGAVRMRARDAAAPLTEEQAAAVEALRCSSKARGSMYSKERGITCHFCRQKMLCTEPDCPHCSSKGEGKGKDEHQPEEEGGGSEGSGDDPEEDGGGDKSHGCIGKTFCRGCSSSTGVFCRACLSLRYGQDLDAVRKDRNWLCPHCYEEKHGEEHGWFCNSSICMRRRDWLPTGIAIHRARAEGFVSVAHLVQARFLARRGKAAPEAAEAGAAAAGGGDADGPATAAAALEVADSQGS